MIYIGLTGQKRRTRATIAKEKGLEPLAAQILLQKMNTAVQEAARDFVSDEKGVENVQEAIDGALDIIAEGISDNAEYRTRIRQMTVKEGMLTSTAKDDTAESVYSQYYQYAEPIKKVADHRVLAINRGEHEKS